MSAEGGVELSELIGRARAGDRSALDSIIARYERYLRLVIGSSMGPVLRREYDASDILQETLLVVVARFAQFHGSDERELLTWLRTLAGRKLIDLARSAGRMKRAPSDRISLDQHQHDTGELLSERVAGDLTSPSRAAAKREMAVKLADALARIDPVEAEVVWLHHVEGLSFEAIGARVGVGRNGARGIWARGLKSLKRILPPGGVSGAD